MMKYWENETPATINTGKNILQYYRDAGKLSVSRMPWTDDKGQEKQGKTVTLDITAMLESDSLSEARDVFTEIIRHIEERMV